MPFDCNWFVLLTVFWDILNNSLTSYGDFTFLGKIAQAPIMSWDTSNVAGKDQSLTSFKYDLLQKLYCLWLTVPLCSILCNTDIEQSLPSPSSGKL